MRVIHGCGLQGLRSLNKGSVDLILSDLPSGETQAEFDQAPELLDLWESVWHALKPDGVAVLMASSIRFASSLISSSEWFRYDLVWSKSKPTGFLNAKKRPLRSHEFILVFSKSSNHTYNVQMTYGASPIHAARRIGVGSENYGSAKGVTESRSGETSRYPVSVVEFSSLGSTDRSRIHPQQKPVHLMRWLVRTYSNRGDMVVDPFAGSGSTLVAAEEESRKSMGFDTSYRFAKDIKGGHSWPL